MGLLLNGFHRDQILNVEDSDWVSLGVGHRDLIDSAFPNQANGVLNQGARVKVAGIGGHHGSDGLGEAFGAICVHQTAKVSVGEDPAQTSGSVHEQNRPGSPATARGGKGVLHGE